MDLFITLTNRQFYSRGGFRPSHTGRCFLVLRTRGLLFVFPPVPLILRVVKKIKQEKAKIIFNHSSVAQADLVSLLDSSLRLSGDESSVNAQSSVSRHFRLSIPTKESFASRLGYSKVHRNRDFLLCRGTVSVIKQ